MRQITEQDLRDKLKRLCQSDSQVSVAESFGYKSQYIWDVLNGKPISERLAEKLGYRMTKAVTRTFEAITTEETR